MKVGKLLDSAEEAANRVVIDVDFKHPDRAYVQYLVFSDILLHVIPRHKDYSAVSSDRGDWQRRYRTLCKVSNLSFVPISCSVVLKVEGFGMNCNESDADSFGLCRKMTRRTL